ncbi:MAG: pilus assembly protein N-terminal domain-containing protein, partial [Sphingomonadaceae bacterium]
MKAAAALLALAAAARAGSVGAAPAEPAPAAGQRPAVAVTEAGAAAPAAGLRLAAPAAAPPSGARSAAPAADLRCSGQAATPGNLQLHLGKSTLMRLPEAIHSRSIGNPAVVQAMLVAPDTLYLAGVDIGSTNLIVQGRSGSCSVIEVQVGVDPSGLQAALAALLPEQKQIRVSAAADALVLTGSVDDAPTIARVLELAAAFVRKTAQALELQSEEGSAAPATPAHSPARRANAASGAR